MGYYRFLLSLLVLVSHWGLFFGPYDQGKSAVIGFFLISGYVMSKLIEKYYSSIANVPQFFIDRGARIFPQYLFYAALTMALIGIFHVGNSWTSGCDVDMEVKNFAVIPLYFSAVTPYYKCSYLPQAWSLALELIFYVFAPLIVIFWNRYLVLAVMAFSLWVYGRSYLGIIDTDTNGFRHLPGTIFIFIIGMSFARDTQFWKIFRWASWAAAAVLWSVLLNDNYLYGLQSNKEVLAGIVLGIPALALCRRLKSTRLERLAGDLSYGVYLNHYLVILFLLKFMPASGHPLLPTITALISIPISALTFYSVERPFIALRRRMRTPKRATAAQA